MTYQKLLLTVLFILCYGLLVSKAQKSLNSGGGEAKSREGSVSYSIGQTVYTADKGFGGSAAKGVQQAYEISTVKQTETLIKLECSIYPNPTVDVLIFKLLDPGYEDLSLSLRDMTGRLISNKDIVSNETRFNMRHLSAGVYLLQVVLKELGQSREIRVFKIVKN
ncbi:MAG: hypothetical protein COC06_08275 [Bacteroidales bacterium]|nr:MAG: hypothetical protein COC06_08275 [Bacteroidales bacterium]